MQNSTLVWIIIAALIILGGGWYLVSQQTPVEDNTNDDINVNIEDERTGDVSTEIDPDVGTGGDSEEGTAPMTATVTYGANGFSPSVVTVKVGGTVTWRNEGGGDMWVASASHPTHTAYDGTTLQEHCGTTGDADTFDQCANGSTFSFTFNKAGTWRYHNHLQSSHFGSVVVEE